MGGETEYLKQLFPSLAVRSLKQMPFAKVICWRFKFCFREGGFVSFVMGLLYESVVIDMCGTDVIFS